MRKRTNQPTRLSDIETEEVSIVDRAANKRRFLTVKREGDTMGVGAEITQAGDGSYTVAKDKEQTQPAGNGVAQATQKAASLTSDQKDVLLAAFDELQGLLDTARDSVKGSKKVETSQEADVTEVCEPLMQLCDMCEDLCMALVGVDDTGAMPPEEGQAPSEGASQEAAGEAAPPQSDDFEKRFEVRCAKRVLEKAQTQKVFKAFIQKFGRKMSKERYNRVNQAMQLLSSVFNEVAPMEVTTEKAKAAPPGKPEEKKPEVKKAEFQLDEGQLSTLNKAVADLSLLIRKQSEDVTALQTIVKGHAAQLYAVSIAKGDRNGVQPDQSANGHHTPIRWGLDMNDPNDPMNRQR